MKSKLVKLILAMTITVMCLFVAAFSANAVFLGDVDLNGKVNAIDARKVLRHAAMIEMLDDSLFARADVNFDKKINASDARLVLRVASQLDEFKENDDILVEQIELAEYNGIKANKLPYTLNGLKIESISYDAAKHNVSVVVRNNTGYAVDSSSYFTYRVYDSVNVLISERTMHVYNMNNNEACLLEFSIHEDAAKVVFFKNEVEKCSYVPSYNMTTVDGIQVNAMPLDLNGVVINSITFDKKYEEAVLSVSNKTGMPIAGTSYISYKVYNNDGYIVTSRDVSLEEMNNNENALVDFYYDAGLTKIVFYMSKVYKSDSLYQGEMVNIDGLSVNKLPYSTNGIVIESVTYDAKYGTVSLVIKNNNNFAVSDSTNIEYKVYNADNFVVKSSSVYTTHLNAGEKCLRTISMPEGATKVVFGKGTYKETDTLNHGTLSQYNGITVNALPYTTNGMKIENVAVDSNLRMNVKLRNVSGGAISSSSWINYKCYDANGIIVKVGSVAVCDLNNNESQITGFYITEETVKVVFLNSKAVARDVKKIFSVASVDGVQFNATPADFYGITIESARKEVSYSTTYICAKVINNSGSNVKDSSFFYYECFDSEGNIVTSSTVNIPRLNMYYEGEVRIRVPDNAVKVVIYDAKIYTVE